MRGPHDDHAHPAASVVGPGWMALLTGANAGRSLLLGGGVALHAAFVFVVATVLPSAVADIGGLAYYAWATTVFVIGSIAGSAAIAIVATRIGPRRAYWLAIALFLVGSGVCATAPSMGVLLIGRAIQGLGGGQLTALAYVMIQQLFLEALRPRAIAMLSVVWGVAALGGPLLGGILAARHAWRAAFWAAVPLGVLVAGLAARILPPRAPVVTARPLPALRLLLLAAAALAVSAGSVPGRVVAATAGIVLALALVACLFRLDQRASVRLLPSGAYNCRVPIGAVTASMALLAAATSTMPFIPYVLQQAHGTHAVVAGYLGALQAMSWPAAALLTASAGPVAARRAVLTGPVVMAIGMAGLTWALPAGWLWLIALCWAVVGVGIGLGWAHLGSALMTLAPPSETDIAAAFISTGQMIALAFGSALAGVVANLAGLAEATTPADVARAASWIFGIFSAAPLGAVMTTARISSQAPASVAHPRC